jgi:hypothetical protein
LWQPPSVLHGHEGRATIAGLGERQDDILTDRVAGGVLLAAGTLEIGVDLLACLRSLEDEDTRIGQETPASVGRIGSVRVEQVDDPGVVGGQHIRSGHGRGEIRECHDQQQQGSGDRGQEELSQRPG